MCVTKIKLYQDAEEVEVLCSTRVVPTLVLELGISVQRVQVLLTKLEKKKIRQFKISQRIHEMFGDQVK